MTLRCYCCGGSYERGKFKCCAAPKNMASHNWLERFCRVTLEDGKLCNKCPRCGCAHRMAYKETGTEIGMATFADVIHPKTHGDLKKQANEWIPPYRETGEEGEL